jgi:hypothetical protein
MGMDKKSHLWASLLVINLALACTTADANPGRGMEAAGSCKDSASEVVAPPAERRAAAVGKASADEVPEVKPYDGACLKEGEQCNPLNDKCCGSYYCTGGLVTRCARKL